MPLLQDHIAVVTGAASGIGRAIASGFAREGARVVLLDIDSKAAGDAAGEIRSAGGKAESFALDVTKREDCFAIAKEIAGKVGQVSILVNNAGINRRNAFTADADAVLKDWQDIMAINLNGVFNVTHALLEPLRASKGRIVNIASVQSFVHMRTPNSPAYTTSKHGVLGFTRALAAELGKHGVRVNAIGPGLIETPLERAGARQQSGADEDLHGSHSARTPRKAGGHRRPRDLPRLRSLLLRHRLDRDGGRRIPVDLGRAMSNAPHYDIDVRAFWADPYPDLARMRKEAPIAFVPQLGSTVLTRREDIFTQEKRTDVFSSHQPAGLMNRLMGHNMMRKDGDAHMSERAAMFPSVSPRAVRDTWVAKFQAHADRILDELAPKGRADLVKAFALPLSAECLKDITGLTNMRYQDMDAWSQAMIDGIANYTGDTEVEARCNAATAGIDAAIDDMLPIVSKHPNGSILSVLLARGPADGKHPRQRQACDLRRPERAARRDLGRGLGAADASGATRTGAQRDSDMARRVRGICALDRADRHVAAPRRQGVALSRRRFRAGGPRLPDVRLGQPRRSLFRRP